MRMLTILAITFCCTITSSDNTILNDGLDFTNKPKEFEIYVAHFPRLPMSEVGSIPTPLPDREGFRVPARWLPVKVLSNDEAVYLVKDGYRFLHPNPEDKNHSTYVLWSDIKGGQPEIILYPCPPKYIRQSIVEKINQEKAERQAEAIRRREEARRNWEKRRQEQQKRAQARQNLRNRRFASVSIQTTQALTNMQPLADVIIDRIKATVHISQEEITKIRRYITSTIALEIQMRDVTWCDAIEKHIAPDMWTYSGSDRLKSCTPNEVIPWLVREIERQVQSAEAVVNQQMMGGVEPPSMSLDSTDGPPRMTIPDPESQKP